MKISPGDYSCRYRQKGFLSKPGTASTDRGGSVRVGVFAEPFAKTTVHSGETNTFIFQGLLDAGSELIIPKSLLLWSTC